MPEADWLWPGFNPQTQHWLSFYQIQNTAKLIAKPNQLPNPTTIYLDQIWPDLILKPNTGCPSIRSKMGQQNIAKNFHVNILVLKIELRIVSLQLSLFRALPDLVGNN